MMTYREIEEYAEGEGWDFSAGGFHRDLMKRGISPDDQDSMPWEVWQWLNHEVLPTIRKADSYEFPSDLNLICPHTNPLDPGRYATEPIE